jgi:hypothetical protein
MDDFVPPVMNLAFSFSNLIYGVDGASHWTPTATPHPEEQVMTLNKTAGLPKHKCVKIIVKSKNFNLDGETPMAQGNVINVIPNTSSHQRLHVLPHKFPWHPCPVTPRLPHRSTFLIFEQETGTSSK